MGCPQLESITIPTSIRQPTLLHRPARGLGTATARPSVVSPIPLTADRQQSGLMTHMDQEAY